MATSPAPRTPAHGPQARNFPPDLGADLFSAETFRRVAAACCLGSLGKTRDLPPWLSLEADTRRASVAAVLRGGIPSDDTYPGKANLSAIARRVGGCTESLMILAPRQAAGYLPMILRCKSRWCPPCALSLGYKRAFQIVGALSGLAAAGRLTHAVYTTPNVTRQHLPAALRALVRAWKTMHGMNGGKSKPDPAAAEILGAVRNLEVTYNPTTDDYHPHIHAILHAPRLDQAAYSDAWDRARIRAGLPGCSTLVWLAELKPKTPPTPGVQSVCNSEKSGRAGREEPPSTALLDAAFEVSKYAVKPLDLTGSDGFPTPDLATVALALKGLHVSQATGDIREKLTPNQRTGEEAHYNRLGSFRHLITHEDLETARQITAAVLSDQAARSVVARHFPLSTILPHVKDFEPWQTHPNSLAPSLTTTRPASGPPTPTPAPSPEPPSMSQQDWLNLIQRHRPTSTSIPDSGNCE